MSAPATITNLVHKRFEWTDDLLIQFVRIRARTTIYAHKVETGSQSAARNYLILMVHPARFELATP